MMNRAERRRQKREHQSQERLQQQGRQSRQLYLDYRANGLMKRAWKDFKRRSGPMSEGPLTLSANIAKDADTLHGMIESFLGVAIQSREAGNRPDAAHFAEKAYELLQLVGDDFFSNADLGYNVVGTARLGILDASGAIEAFERAHQLNPDQEVVAGNLALARFAAGQMQAAIDGLVTMAKHHCQTDAEAGEWLNTWAATWMSDAGLSVEHSLVVLDAAVALAPDYQPAKLNRLWALQILGRLPATDSEQLAALGGRGLIS